jgi:hypothetical protein
MPDQRREIAPKDKAYYEVHEMLEALGHDEILVLIAEVYQVESINTRVLDHVCNGPYYYTITAILSHPACYDDAGIEPMQEWDRQGEGSTPKLAIIALAMKLWNHAYRYLRTCDAFCVEPYTRENHGQLTRGEMRCQRCGRVMDGTLLLDGDRYSPLCHDEKCPYHTVAQHP